MTAATIDAAVAATDAPRKRKRKASKKLLIVIAAVVLVGAAGYYLKVVKPAAAKRAAAVAATQPGGIETLDSLTVNLADGHLLRVGLALQLTKASTPKGTSDGAPATDAVDGAQALDAAITIFGGRSYPQLLAPTGRARAVAALSKEVARRYRGKVMKVYLTEFVMQ